MVGRVFIGSCYRSWREHPQQTHNTSSQQETMVNLNVLPHRLFHAPLRRYLFAPTRRYASYCVCSTLSSPTTSVAWRLPISYMSTSSSAVEPRRDALTSSDGVVGRPIDFDIASSIEGKESQVRIGLLGQIYSVCTSIKLIEELTNYLK